MFPMTRVWSVWHEGREIWWGWSDLGEILSAFEVSFYDLKSGVVTLK